MSSLFTTEELDQLEAVWKDALRRVAAGQSVAVNGESYTQANVEDIRRTLEWLRRERAILSGESGPVFAQGVVIR